MKKGKEKKEATKKVGLNIKEVVPFSGKLPRDLHPIPHPEGFTHKYEANYYPFDIFPEWPGDEAALAYDFSLNANFDTGKQELFIDNYHIVLPYSLTNEVTDIKWIRPDKYIRQRNIEKELKSRMPNRNTIKVRSTINELFEKVQEEREQKEKEKEKEKTTIREKDITIVKEQDDENESMVSYMKHQPNKLEVDKKVENKKKLYKEFFSFLSQKIDIKVCDFMERDESEEEIRKRLEEKELLEKMKADMQANEKGKKPAAKPSPQKHATKKDVTKEETIIEPLKVRDLKITNIDMSEKYCRYSKWVASQLQLINDLHIVDVNTGKSLCQRIFPQEKNVPVVSPSGKYWVKLYHMGKLRKVEIDDRMPCGVNDEFLLPKCEKMELIWPHLITKALLKLYSYQYSSGDYVLDEIGDMSIVYALTGYIGEKIVFQENDNGFEMFQHILRDSTYKNKQKFTVCYHTDHHPKRSEFTHSHNFIRKPVQKKLTMLGVGAGMINTSKNMPEIKSGGTSILSHLTSQIAQEKATSGSVNATTSTSIGRVLHKRATMNPTYRMSFNSDSANKSIKDSLKMSDNKLDLHTLLKKSTKKEGDKSIIESMKKTGSTTGGSKVFNVSESVKFQMTEEVNERYGEIFKDFAYGVVEVFTNHNFNMQRIKPLDFSDLKKKIQDAKVSYKQLTKEEKKVYIAKLLDLKAKQKEEKQKRIEELKQSGIKHQLIKIKNEASGGSRLNFYIPFNNDEIEMAKCCILNGWEFPPPTFFDPFFVYKKPKSVIQLESMKKESTDTARGGNAGSIGGTGTGTGALKTPKTVYKEGKLDDSFDSNNDGMKSPAKSGWNRDVYLQLLNHNVDIYNDFDDPLKRVHGHWLNVAEFVGIMNNIIVFHNPKFYKNHLNIDKNWYNYKTEPYEPQSENRIFLLSPPGSGPTDIYNNCKTNEEKNCILVSFEPNYTKNQNFSNITSYIVIQLFTKDGMEMTDEICLQNHFSTYQCDLLEPDDCYYLIIKSEVVPFGYTLNIYTDHNLEPMSMLSYLKSEKGYQDYSFKTELPSIVENSFFLCQKLKIELEEERVLRFFLEYPDKNLKKYFSIFLHHRGNKKRIYEHEDVTLTAELDHPYFISVELHSPYSVPEASLEFTVLCEHHVKVENLELIDPYEVSDKYVPNRHGIVFKELLYAPEHVFTTMKIDLKTEIVTQIPNPSTDTKKKDYTPMIDKFEYEDLKDKIRLKIELFNKNGELVKFYENFNSQVLDFELFGYPFVPPDTKPKKGEIPQNNPPPEPYNLVCKLDLSEAPEWITNVSYCTNIKWIVRVFATNTVGFLKNTIKEDSEQALKDGWEETEPGRYDLAKRSRLLFLVNQKRRLGHRLSDEEESSLKLPPRQRKISMPVNMEELPKISSRGDLKGGRKPPPPDPKKKDVQEKPLVNPEYQIDLNKPNLPTLHLHTALNIRKFLSYCYESRTKEIDSGLKEKKCKGESERILSKNEIIELYELNERQKQLDMEEYLKYKNFLVEEMKKHMSNSTESRRELKKLKEPLIGIRDELKGNIDKVKDIERRLKEILVSDGVDVNYCVQIYKEVCLTNYKSELLDQVFNFISVKKEDSIKNDMKKLTAKDKVKVTAILDEIRQGGWRISEETMNALTALVS